MASPRIPYNTATPFGAMTAKMVDDALAATANAKRVKAALDSIVGWPADYALLEGQLGVTPGQGQAFYNTVAGIAAALDAIVGLPDIDQGDV